MPRRSSNRGRPSWLWNYGSRSTWRRISGGSAFRKSPVLQRSAPAWESTGIMRKVNGKDGAFRWSVLCNDTILRPSVTLGLAVPRMSGANQVIAKPRISTGITGLDTVLHGGLPAHRIYLVEGDPGTGKTTLAMQFILDGIASGGRSLYITLSETEAELQAMADSHGWSLAGVEIFELIPAEANLDPSAQYTFFHTEEVELGETVKTLLERVEQVQPTHLVTDSLAELRLLA